MAVLVNQTTGINVGHWNLFFVFVDILDSLEIYVVLSLTRALVKASFFVFRDSSRALMSYEEWTEEKEEEPRMCVHARQRHKYQRRHRRRRHPKDGQECKENFNLC